MAILALAGCATPQEAAMPTSTSDNPAMAHGADIGWLSQFESRGVTWVDSQGTLADPVALLKGFGIDSIRLRVMVNPDLTSSVGFTDQAHVVAMAQRCAALGMKIFIDFHFSDTWADPGHQTVPAAWQNDTFGQLAIHLAGHVTSVLAALKAVGITPAWVQLGNEIPDGILWGSGAVTGYVSGTSGWSNLASLLNAGYAAVKASDSAIPVVLHLDRGYDNAMYRWWFDNFQAAGGKWDVVGMSFYPYWQPSGTVAQLQTNLNDMVARYGKKVMVCEVGGLYNDPAGTKTLLLAVKSAVASVTGGNGLGFFYWEPESSPSVVVGGYLLGASKAVGTNQLQFTDAMTAF